MDFKFIYHSSLFYKSQPPTFENIFRVGYPDHNKHDCNGAGTRYPALHIYHDHDGNNKQADHPYIPYLIFSLSHKHDCWHQVSPQDLYPILTNASYSVTIRFNETWIFISIINLQTNNITIIADESRPNGTSSEFIDHLMNIWISEHGTPSANVTLYDMKITTKTESIELDSITSTRQPVNMSTTEMENLEIIPTDGGNNTNTTMDQTRIPSLYENVDEDLYDEIGSNGSNGYSGTEIFAIVCISLIGACCVGILIYHSLQQEAALEKQRQEKEARRLKRKQQRKLRRQMRKSKSVRYERIVLEDPNEMVRRAQTI